MYNEPFTQLLESLAGCYRAYYELVGIDEEYIDKVHICIISDGYEKLSEEFLQRCELAGIYNEFETKRYRSIETPAGSDEPKHVFKDLKFINKDTMNERIRVYGTNNIAHCFSRKLRFPEFLNSLDADEQNNFMINKYYVNDFLVGDDSPGKVKTKKYFHLPMPVHFAIKHRNLGKIESHKWFFKGFCEYMNPRYAQIIDCGSIPLWNSISHIVMHMEAFPQVGGACGEIECIIEDKKPDGQHVTFVESIFLRAQYVEYKISHYLDKATETMFGFVSVLPGAFSTFRWACIKNDPLDAFLKGASDEFGDLNKIMSCVDANKYLAEDRIMCLEIIAQKDRDDLIHYIPGAKCLTDPPLSLTQLIKQRRRWFNGSMFASLHVLNHMCRIWYRRDSFVRNIGFMFLYLYMIIQMILSFIIVGTFYGVFSIFLRSVMPSSDCGYLSGPANIIESIYITFLFFVILLSTLVEITWVETSYRICSMVMGLFSLVMVVNSIIYVKDASITSLGVVFLFIYLLSFSVPLVTNATSVRVCDFVKGAIYCVYLAPTYVNLITIYAISNIHDVSWGSRDTALNPTFAAIEKRRDLEYRNYRAKFLIFWAIVNYCVGVIMLALYTNGNLAVISILGIFLVSIMLFRIVLSFIHRIKAHCDKSEVHGFMYKKKSTVFENVHLHEDIRNSDVFSIFYEEDEEVMQKIPSSKKVDCFSSGKHSAYTASHKFGNSSMHTSRRSSIRGMNVIRGFPHNAVREQLDLAQGRVDAPKTPKAQKLALKTKGYDHLADSDDIGSISSSNDSVSDSASSHFTTNDYFRFKVHREPSVMSGASSGSDNIANSINRKMRNQYPTPMRKKFAWIMEEEKTMNPNYQVDNNHDRNNLTECIEQDMEESNMSGTMVMDTQEMMMDSVPELKSMKGGYLNTLKKKPSNDYFIDYQDTARNQSLNETAPQETSRQMNSDK